MHRVQKLLSNYGYCSRRKAEELIADGRVKVNDKIISLGDKASEKDEIKVDNKLIKKERKIYLIFNKPLGCVTALKDKKYKTVIDYIKIKERVFPVGRLDYNTSGLLLLTNDGDFSNKIMHPRNEIKKTYLVQVDEYVRDSDLKRIEKGIKLDDGKTSPAKVKLKDGIVEVTIHEGKNRIVRRIFDALGYRIKTLHRYKIGHLSLGNLKSGRYRTLNRKDMKKLFD
tara:strand:+ start:392 stop:1069 length:678 start_codon:yes stop_codon:yes gene_type:complete